MQTWHFAPGAKYPGCARPAALISFGVRVLIFTLFLLRPLSAISIPSDYNLVLNCMTSYQVSPCETGTVTT